LNSIGFDWTRQNEVLKKESVAELKTTDNNKNWDVHFRDLLAYLQEYGDCNPPQGDPRNIWVREQRNDYDLKHRGDEESIYGKSSPKSSDTGEV
jgi:hypothetical protein